jgi:hypothetical protein
MFSRARAFSSTQRIERSSSTIQIGLIASIVLHYSCEALPARWLPRFNAVE